MLPWVTTAVFTLFVPNRFGPEDTTRSAALSLKTDGRPRPLIVSNVCHRPTRVMAAIRDIAAYGTTSVDVFAATIVSFTRKAVVAFPRRALVF